MQRSPVGQRGRRETLRPERSLRSTALDLLSRREHTRRELGRKLKAKKFLSAEVDELLDLLENEGLQSDARYTESYVHSRRRRGFGPLKIKLELQDRGVSVDLVDTFVDADHQVWLDTARREYAKKFGNRAAAESMQEQAKRMSFLQLRGFTNDIIRETLTPVR